MTDDELRHLRNKVDEAVRIALEKELTAKRVDSIHRELDTALRAEARRVIEGHRDAMREKIEAWFETNAAAHIERVAKETLDEALREVRRRVLGR